ncbi:MAG: NUDIX domain-containing protein [Candidatus Nanohalobium sp.]
MKDSDRFDSIDVAMNIVEHIERRESGATKFLVLKKSKKYREHRERYAENPWEVPGGKIELGKEEYTEEEIKEEAWRELNEETDLPVKKEEFKEKASTAEPYSNRQEGVEITFYPVLYSFQKSLESVQTVSEEHESFEWISEEEFSDRMTENEIEALERVQ